MLLSKNISSYETPITPKLKLEYADLKIISEEASYITLQAKHRNTEQLHTIRVLNPNSAFVKEDYHVAATLFIQELLRLCISSPQDVLIETFEIYDKKISYATLPYSQLKKHVADNELNHAEINIDKLLKNVVSDLEFLVNNLRFKNCSSIVSLENIYQLEKSGNYFLGNWAQTILSDNSQQVASTDPNAGYQNRPPVNMFEEIYSLGLVVLELNGLKKEEAETLRAMRDSNPLYEITLISLIKDRLHLSENLRDLLIRMLSKTASQRPKIDEFKLRRSISNIEEEEEKSMSISGSKGDFRLDPSKLFKN